jgi:hypothetical protein
LTKIKIDHLGLPGKHEFVNPAQELTRRLGSCSRKVAHTKGTIMWISLSTFSTTAAIRLSVAAIVMHSAAGRLFTEIDLGTFDEFIRRTWKREYPIAEVRILARVAAAP